MDQQYLINNTIFDGIKQKLKSKQLFVHCNRGSEHCQVQAFCIDPKCSRRQQLEPLCPQCRDEDTHQQSENHKTDFISFIIKNIASQAIQLMQTTPTLNHNILTLFNDVENSLTNMEKVINQTKEGLRQIKVNYLNMPTHVASNQCSTILQLLSSLIAEENYDNFLVLKTNLINYVTIQPSGQVTVNKPESAGIPQFEKLIEQKLMYTQQVINKFMGQHIDEIILQQINNNNNNTTMHDNNDQFFKKKYDQQQIGLSTPVSGNYPSFSLNAGNISNITINTSNSCNRPPEQQIQQEVKNFTQLLHKPNHRSHKSETDMYNFDNGYRYYQLQQQQQPQFQQNSFLNSNNSITSSNNSILSSQNSQNQTPYEKSSQYYIQQQFPKMAYQQQLPNALFSNRCHHHSYHNQPQIQLQQGSPYKCNSKQSYFHSIQQSPKQEYFSNESVQQSPQKQALTERSKEYQPIPQLSKFLQKPGKCYTDVKEKRSKLLLHIENSVIEKQIKQSISHNAYKKAIGLRFISSNLSQSAKSIQIQNNIIIFKEGNYYSQAYSEKFSRKNKVTFKILIKSKLMDTTIFGVAADLHRDQDAGGWCSSGNQVNIDKAYDLYRKPFKIEGQFFGQLQLENKILIVEICIQENKFKIFDQDQICVYTNAYNFEDYDDWRFIIGAANQLTLKILLSTVN